MIFKFALRELFNSKRFCFLFILNFTFGLLGFVMLESFNDSLRQRLSQNTKEFLSADLSVSSRRAMSEQENNLLQKEVLSLYQHTRVWEFFSMASVDQRTRLVQVKAIENGFPYYGSIKLGSGNRLSLVEEERSVWVYPELLNLLKAKIGDKIKIGDEVFTIKDTVLEDTTQTFRLASIAPKVYVARKWFINSKMLSFGRTMTEAVLIKTNADNNS